MDWQEFLTQVKKRLEEAKVEGKEEIIQGVKVMTYPHPTKELMAAITVLSQNAPTDIQILISAIERMEEALKEIGKYGDHPEGPQVQGIALDALNSLNELVKGE